MSTESVCRLCVENAKCYESLYDSNGQKSDVYLLVVKFFDETLINFERAQHLREICLKCLQKIQYFDHFQKIVIRAQEKLLEDHKEVKTENNLTGYDEEFSSFHINDKSKHDLPLKENKLSNQCNNDAVCERPEESEHIKVPKLELVDSFSGDESLLSNHEEFLDHTPSAYSIYSGLSVCSLSNGKTIENSGETIHVNKVKNNNRSAEELDKTIAKILPSVECGMCKEKQPTFTHLVQHFNTEHSANECYTMCCGKSYKRRYMLASHVSRVHSGPNAYSPGPTSCKFCNKTFLTRNGLIAHHTRVHKPKNLKVSRNRSPKDIDDYIAKLLPNVECGMCKEKQPSFTHLVQHFKSEHPAKECHATCCGTVFKKRSKLERHVSKLHSGPTALSCKLCNKSFLVRKSLIMHMRAHNPKYHLTMDAAIAQLRPTLECVVCKETSTSYSLLQNHFKSKHPLEKFHIMCCNRKLKGRFELHRHLQFHENPNAFKCDVCNIPFSDRQSLLRHISVFHPKSNVEIVKLANDPIKTSECNNDVVCVSSDESKHTEVAKLEIVDVFPGEESIQCKDGEFFDSTLSAHRIHSGFTVSSFSGDKNHNIDQNDISTVEKADVTINVNKVAPKKSAEDIDNYIAKLLPSVECGMCKVKQLTFTHLLQHFKSEHPAKECYTMCCGKRFKWRSSLARHVHCLHSGPNSYSCKLCNRTFLTQNGLILHHTRVHKPKNLKASPNRSPKDIDDYIAKFLPNVECGMCKEKQPTFTHLLQHFKSEHPAKKCHAMCCGTVYKKRSKLARHVSCVHSGPNALSCKLCKKSFLLRKSLMMHMRAHNPKYHLTMDAAIAQLRPRLECEVCKESSTSYSLLQNHFKSKHPLEKFRIMCCNRKLKGRYELHRHLQFHENPNAFKCDVCNIPFSDRQSLLRHISVFHLKSNIEIAKLGNDPIKTSECNNDVVCVSSDESKHIEVAKLEIVDVFSGDESIQYNDGEFFDSTLSTHSIHSGLSAKSCSDQNDSNSIDKSEDTFHVNKLKNKIRSAEDIDNHIAKLLANVECGMCKEKQPTFTHLLQHFKSEHPAKECYAMCCGKKFKKRSCLASHVNSMHSASDDYSCKHCNIPFWSRRSLTVHMRTHNPIKSKVSPKRSHKDIDDYIAKLLPSVECGMCKELQPTFTHLALHFTAEHPAKECYTICCGTMFKQRSQLARHVSKLHSAPNTSSCELCNNSFLSRKSLISHTRAHKVDAAIAQLRPSLECVVCKETCKTYSLLQYHFESKHPFDEFYIICCKRKLKDRSHLHQHLQFHENQNAFECNVCKKSFTERPSLLRHMRVFHPTSNVGNPKRIDDPRKISECYNDAVCLRSEESKHKKVPNIEIVNAFSGDESIV